MTNSQQTPATQQMWAGQPATHGRGAPNGSHDQHPIEDRYNTHDASFRRHYQLNYHDNGHGYEAFYAPAYRFGFELGEESGSATWDEVKEAAQRHWQANHPSAWADIAEAVHYGWREQRNPDALRVHHYAEYDTYRPGFQNHYQEVTDTDGLAFDYYEPAYHYGYTLAVDPAYHGYEWAEMEPEVRKYYETEYADAQLPWERYRDAVQHAWQGVRAVR
ncbi:MAG: hypothetical protein DYG89_49595 [Caldilinea sp. CFX5]|nr:hypothetical protein [Caldilinea sp. CFX5]